jgi:hypothetical protein
VGGRRRLDLASRLDYGLLAETLPIRRAGRKRARACAAIVGAAVSLAAAPGEVRAAAPATLKGSLIGAHLPAVGRGVASVRAVRLGSGVMAAADYTDRHGSWRIQAPAGSYALMAAVMPFNGGKVLNRPVALVRARSGRTRTLRLSLKRMPKKRRARATVSPGFGDVSVSYPAIWVHDFNVNSTDPELGVLRKGLAAMVITDLYDSIHAFRPRCRAVLVERERIGDVVNEQRLQQLPGFDPSTRVPTGRLIRDNSSVTGTLTNRGGQVALSATYVNRRSGKRGTVSVQGSVSQIFELEQELAGKLARLICDESPLYLGEVSGSLRIDEQGECADHEQYSYSASLRDFSSSGSARPFAIVQGSGAELEGGGAQAYNETGSGTYTLDPCEPAQTAGCSTGMQRRADGSEGIVFFDVMGSTVEATVIPFGWQSTSNGCGTITRLGEVTTIGAARFPLSMVGADTITAPISRRDETPRLAVGSGTLTLRRAE